MPIYGFILGYLKFFFMHEQIIYEVKLPAYNIIPNYRILSFLEFSRVL